MLTTNSGLVTGIKKGQTLKELVEGHDAQKVDTEREAIIDESSEQNSELLCLFESHLRSLVLPSMRTDIDQVLTPEEINIFLQITAAYETHPKYKDFASLFISHLIQNSYNAGNNDFVLDVRALCEIDKLAGNLTGTEDRPINITAKGDVGDSFGCYCKYGNVTLKGNTKMFFGYNAEYSNFTITGKLDECACHWARNSIFRIMDRNNLDNMARTEKCKAYLVNPDGTEEEFKIKAW